MSGQIVDEQNFYNIANAIRNKNGESTLYRPMDMSDAISDIPHYSIESIINRSITSFSDSNITSIGAHAFNSCISLTTIGLPSCTTIGDNAFNNCTSLTSINLLSCTTIVEDAFSGCTSLSSITLPACRSIGNSAFANCSSLISIKLLESLVCTLGTNAFNNTTIASGNGYIYVPSDLVDTYKAATNWSTYANQIVAIPEEEGE